MAEQAESPDRHQVRHRPGSQVKLAIALGTVVVVIIGYGLYIGRIVRTQIISIT